MVNYMKTLWTNINMENENIFIATGFNTWGMTNGWLSGKIISDIIMNKNNPYIDIFKPNRTINTKSFFKLIINSLGYLKVYTQTFIKKNYKFYHNKTKVIYENGKYIGVYTDQNRKKHKCNNLCPHLKCHLIFNYNEKTWDCSCHGSRFDIDGNIIASPSSIDIKKQELFLFFIILS